MNELNYMLDFESPCGRFVLTIDDDGKVAYAYLKTKKGIVGDVWLYNRCPTPAEPEWSDRSKLPFANCSDYMSEAGRLTRPVTVQDVIVEWEYEDDQPTAYIYLFEDLYGVVGVNDRPGYARFAIKNNALALVMEIED